MFGDIFIQCLNGFYPVDKLPEQVVFLLGLFMTIAIFMSIFAIIFFPFKLISKCI